MSEEHKITTGTISGATFENVDIEPSIIVDGKSYTASEFNKAIEMLKQPQLNENQKINTNNKLLKINDLAFELQHDDKLTKEQWDKVEQIYKLSLPMQLNESQQYIEEYVEMAIEQLREANLILNKVYEKDRFAREIQNDISEIMDTLNYRYFGEQEED